MLETDTPDAVTPVGQHDPYSALRLRSYRLFISGRMIFLLGSQMQSAAVGWQIYERLGSKMALGWVGLVQMIPILLLTLPAGNLADRLNRKKIIIGAQTLFLICSLGLGAVSLFHGAVVWIYTLLFFLAVGRSLSMPAMGALLPTVIPREVWGNATTWNSSVFELTQMVGPAVAGGLIAASGGSTFVYFFAAACALASLLLFSQLNPSPQVVHSGLMKLHDFIGGIRGLLALEKRWQEAKQGVAFAMHPTSIEELMHVADAGLLMPPKSTWFEPKLRCGMVTHYIG